MAHLYDLDMYLELIINNNNLCSVRFVKMQLELGEFRTKFSITHLLQIDFILTFWSFSSKKHDNFLL